MAAEVIATAAGRVVKMLGDEVLFVADDPVAAATIGLGLLDAIDVDGELPDLRIGMARGNVLSRFGDVYGPVVNIASRLTSAAKPGTVLVDRELATALASEPGLRLRPAPADVGAGLQQPVVMAAEPSHSPTLRRAVGVGAAISRSTRPFAAAAVRVSGPPRRSAGKW